MWTSDYYASLGISKSATEAEIKKAYKKKAMEYHPDRNKWDKNAEQKFKEINEAYQTLGDANKKKNYDQFWSAEWNPFWWWGWYRSRSSWWSGGDFSWFEDIFAQFWWTTWSSGRSQWGFGGFEFDLGDLFSGGWATKKKTKTAPKEEEKVQLESLDVTEIVEIPFLDFLYETSLSVKTVYGKVLTLKVKPGTRPGTKFKISGKWRTTDGRTGDMYVIVDAKMPTNIDANIMKMIDAIRYQI